MAGSGAAWTAGIGCERGRDSWLVQLRLGRTQSVCCMPNCTAGGRVEGRRRVAVALVPHQGSGRESIGERMRLRARVGLEDVWQRVHVCLRGDAHVTLRRARARPEVSSRALAEGAAAGGEGTRGIGRE